MGVILLFMLLALSQGFLKSGAQASSHFQTIGELLRTGRDLVNHAGMILPLSIGGLMLYYLFYQTKLVRRWLSSWGLVGTAVTIAASFLFMFHVIELRTSVYMNFPLAFQEMD
jgi:hypothetical protein